MNTLLVLINFSMDEVEFLAAVGPTEAGIASSSRYAVYEVEQSLMKKQILGFIFGQLFDFL